MRNSRKRPLGTVFMVVVALFATLLGTVPIAEAQGANLALGQPATQASEWLNNPGPASRAVDGSTDGLFANGSVTHTGGGTNDWWQVDLGSSTNVGSVNLFNRTDCCSDRLTNFYVFVSATDLTGRSLTDIVGDASVNRVHFTQTAGASETVVANAAGRYVRVQRIGSGILSLAEVQVFAAGGNGGNNGGEAFVINPGDQRAKVGDSIRLPISYGGTIDVVGLPGGFSFTNNEIVGTTERIGRWPIELRVSGDNNTSDIAYFQLLVTDGPAPGEVSEHPAVDPREVSVRPMEGGDGVVWRRANPDTTTSLDITVWDMQQVGDYMYVGGEFQQVIEQGPNGADGALHNQSNLARFSIATGKWDPSFRPNLDGNVHALEVSPRGRLLVGGEFTNIDGQPGTEGIAAINPNTGQVDPTFEAWVERPWYPEGRAIVRELEVVGGFVYIGGNFSHINGPAGQRVRVNKLTRVGANYGTIDASWNPVVSGGSVWGIGVDQDRGRVYFSGRFQAVNGNVVGTTATVDTETGDSVILADHVRNAPNRPEMYDIEYAGNALWAAGSQHVLQLHNADTHVLQAWNHAGNGCNNYCWQGTGQGGDFQFVEKIGDFVYSGCHCNDRTSTTHYSSVTGLRSPHTVAMAYHLDGALVTEVEFDIGGHIDGGWSVASDDVGCIWLGGDIIDGGFREPGGRVFARGFARFCDTEIRVPQNLEVAAALDSGIRLEWDAISNANGYAVFRDGSYLGFAEEAFYVDTTVVAGRSYEYEVRSENFQGTRSDPSNSVEGVVGSVDNEAPSVPSNLTAISVGETEVIFTWDASVDNLGVNEYLVYRDGAYIGFVPVGETSFTDAGRDNFARHTYRVRAVDFNDNRSALSAPLDVQLGGVDVEAPSIPDNLDVESVTETSIEISWDASTDNAGVVEYIVFRDGANLGPIPGDQTSFNDTGLASFAQHRYRVRAIDAAGNESDLSDPLDAQVGGADTEAPTVPQNLVTTNVTDTSVELSWDASTDNNAIQSYLVYRDGAFIAWRPADVTTYLDDGLASGTYEYTVRAVDVSANRSERTEVLSVLVGDADLEAPSVPANLAAVNVTDTSAELTWNPSTDNVAVNSYLVYRDGGFVAWRAGDITTYVDTGLAAGSYTYEVRAVDAVGNRSDLSAPLTVQVGAVDVEAPSIPQGLVAVNVADTSVELAWNPSTDNVAVNSYLVLRDGGFIGWAAADVTTYVDTGLAAGTYTYEVRAVDAVGNRSELSERLVVVVGPADVEAPSVPQNLAAINVTDTSVELAWNPSTDNVAVNSYLVLRDGAFIEWTAGDITSYTDAGLAAGTYTYEVRAVDAAGNRSERSTELVVLVGPADIESPLAPQNVIATPLDDTTVQVTWDMTTDNVAVTSYLVYRDGGFIAWTPADVTSYTDAGLAAGDYTYAVRAVDAAGNRSDPPSAVDVSVGADDVEAPFVPQNLLAGIVTNNSAEIRWDPSIDNVEVRNYLVYRDGAYIGWTPGPSYNDTGLIAGQTYQYTVRAVDTSDNRSDASLPLAVTPL